MRHLVIWIGLVAGCSTPAPRLEDPIQGMFRRLDADGSGALTADELGDPEAQRVVELLDSNGSGDLDPDELRETLAAPPPPRSSEGPKLEKGGKRPPARGKHKAGRPDRGKR